MKILNSHAKPVEAELAERFKVRARSDAGIHFDADFAVGRKMKTFARKSEQVLNLLRRKIGGRAAAPVKLHDGTILGNAAADAFRLTLQYIQIRRRDTLVFLNHYVASAKQAQAFAERDMHVQRNGRLRAFCFTKNFFQITRAKRVVPNGRGRVTRVARAGTIIFRQKFFAHAQLAPHLLERWIGKRHRCGLYLDCAAGRTSWARTCWPVSTKSRAFSTGVFGNIPWPRFRICPRPASEFIVSSVASRIFSAAPSKTAGSRFPCNAILGPSAPRTSPSSTRQSTLNTLAPDLAAADSRCCEAFV